MRFGTSIGYDIIECTIIIAGLPLTAKDLASSSSTLLADPNDGVPDAALGRMRQHIGFFDDLIRQTLRMSLDVKRVD
jgi:hypothetical protein